MGPRLERDRLQNTLGSRWARGAGVQLATSAVGELGWAGKPQVGGPGRLPNLSEGGGPQSVVSWEAPRLCRTCQSRSERQTTASETVVY